MQAQKEAPADMVCKDKFLIQSTIVPTGTTDEDITSSLVGSCIKLWFITTKGSIINVHYWCT